MNASQIKNIIHAQLAEARALRNDVGVPAQVQQQPMPINDNFVNNLTLAIQQRCQLAVQQSLSQQLSRSSSNVSVGQPLSRSSSNASMSSVQTLSSLPLTPNVPVSSTFVSPQDDEDSSGYSSCSSSDERRKRKRRKKYKKNKSRRRKRKQQRKRREDNLARDKKAVNDELMRLIDMQFLAPFQSPMFYRKLKKSSPEGRKILKQYEDIDLALFKSVTRHLRAKLCSRDLNRLRQKDPTLTADTLNDRYEEAMFVLAKKRRANHIQSWRIYKTHCRLIYSSGSTDSEYQRLHAGFYKKNQDNPVQKKSDTTTSTEVAAALPAAALHAAAQPVRAESVSEPDFSESDDTEFDFSESEEESQQPESESIPPVSMHKVTTPCAECGKQISHNSAFPQDKRGQWGTKTPLRCKECWKSHVNLNLIPKMAVEEARAKKSRQFEKANRDITDDKPRKKRAKRTQCRCGSTSHVSIRHSKCPLNPKNIESETDSETHAERIVKTREIVLANRRKATTPTPSPSTPATPTPSPSTSATATPSPSTPATPTPSTPAPTTAPQPFMPKVGDNVLCRFRRNEWYLAHVTKKVTNTTFDVYFPEDCNDKKGVAVGNLRPVHPHSPEPRRDELIGKSFEYPGDDDIPAGRWTVRRMKNDENVYVCTAHDPKAVINCDDFAIGFVIQCYKKDLQLQHENPFRNS